MEKPSSAGADIGSLPAVADRATFQAELDALRVREKAHTREGDAIAAARRRLPMVEVDAATPLTGGRGPVTLLEAFQGRRRQLIATSCGTPADPQPSSAKAARCTPPRSRSCPTCILATSPTRSSARAPTTRRPLPRLHGLGHAVVLSTRLPRRAPRRAPNRLVPPRVLSTGRRPRLRNLMDDPPRRRGNGLQLRAHGPHRVRAPGVVGGLAPRPATTVASRQLQHAD